ncbi:MAG TPA: hypothetical protein VGO53_06590 [Steroidobacteraceae bacterium]|jgi:hypothetical protein|nr:hypothetical protein [Steroidobacteraceae bacterium]
MKREHYRDALPATLCVVVLNFLAAGLVSAEEKRALPGMTYESLRDLPDWSGWWGLPQPNSAEFEKQPPPMRPQDLARYRTAGAQDSDAQPGRYCKPPKFVGYSGGFVEGVEFLFTPGRVTLTNGTGLIRRIYTDGRSLPADVDATNSGTSVGHWEGKVLVVETGGVDPAAPYPQAISGAISVGRNVKITERISLTPDNKLRFDVVTVAPDIFLATDRRTRIYSRIPESVAKDISFCVDFDRSVDSGTGRQRFDMTPPAGLPPPPPP